MLVIIEEKFMYRAIKFNSSQIDRCWLAKKIFFFIILIETLEQRMLEKKKELAIVLWHSCFSAACRLSLHWGFRLGAY